MINRANLKQQKNDKVSDKEKEKKVHGENHTTFRQ